MKVFGNWLLTWGRVVSWEESQSNEKSREYLFVSKIFIFPNMYINFAKNFINIGMIDLKLSEDLRPGTNFE